MIDEQITPKPNGKVYAANIQTNRVITMQKGGQARFKSNTFCWHLLFVSFVDGVFGVGGGDDCMVRSISFNFFILFDF